MSPFVPSCRELAGPEDGRIYYVSNLPVIDVDGTTAKPSVMYGITEFRRLEENLRGDKGFSEGVINSLTGIFFFERGLLLICCNRNLEEISGH